MEDGCPARFKFLPDSRRELSQKRVSHKKPDPVLFASPVGPKNRGFGTRFVREGASLSRVSLLESQKIQPTHESVYVNNLAVVFRDVVTKESL